MSNFYFLLTNLQLFPLFCHNIITMSSRAQNSTSVAIDTIQNSSITLKNNASLLRQNGGGSFKSEPEQNNELRDTTNVPKYSYKHLVKLQEVKLKIENNKYKARIINQQIKPFSERVQQAGLINKAKSGNLPIQPYISEIQSHLRDIEGNFLPSTSFMINQIDLNGSMRAMLVDWLVEVHCNFNLNEETLFLTVNIVDRFLSRVHVSKHNFQLVGIAALLIACKFEEVVVPKLDLFVSITENAFSVKQLLQTERNILDTLEFDLAWASPNRFLELYNEKTKMPSKGLAFCRFLLELSLLDSEMSSVRPSLLVITVMKISGKMNGFAVDETLLSQHSKNEVKECSLNVCASLDKLKSTKLQAVRTKYMKQGIRL